MGNSSFQGAYAARTLADQQKVGPRAAAGTIQAGISAARSGWGRILDEATRNVAGNVFAFQPAIHHWIFFA